MMIVLRTLVRLTSVCAFVVVVVQGYNIGGGSLLLWWNHNHQHQHQHHNCFGKSHHDRCKSRLFASKSSTLSLSREWRITLTTGKRMTATKMIVTNKMRLMTTTMRRNPSTTRSCRCCTKSCLCFQFLHPMQLDLVPQQLGQYQELDLSEDEFEVERSDSTIMTGNSSSGSSSSSSNSSSPSSLSSLQQNQRRKRRVWVENWVFDDDFDDDPNRQSVPCSRYTKNGTSSTYVDFQYAWQLQRDVLLQGHLNRLKYNRMLEDECRCRGRDRDRLQQNEQQSSPEVTRLLSTSPLSSSSTLSSLPTTNSSFLQDEDYDSYFLEEWNGTSTVTLTQQQRRRRQKLRNKILSTGKDTILILQHEPVYTLGTGSDERFILQLPLQQQQQHRQNNGNSFPLPFVHESSSSSSFMQSPSNTISKPVVIPVIRMDRGGEVTYHGPGQLTVYPILDLRSNYKPDIHWYVRALEEAVIVMLNKYCFCNESIVGFNDDSNDDSNSNSDHKNIVRAYREPNVTGVWVQNKKIAAIGIKCRQWITQHGVAINIEEQCLTNFNTIIPCGLIGREVGCVNEFLPKSKQLSMEQAGLYMEYALADIFQIELIHSRSLLLYPPSSSSSLSLSSSSVVDDLMPNLDELLCSNQNNNTDDR